MPASLSFSRTMPEFVKAIVKGFGNYFVQFFPHQEDPLAADPTVRKNVIRPIIVCPSSYPPLDRDHRLEWY
jgi:hypothetical protein